MDMKGKLNKISKAGFTAFELIGVLVVLMFLIITTNKIINNIDRTREYNQLADQSKTFSYKAARYIEDNYRNRAENTITMNDQIIPYFEISSHIPEGLSAFTKAGQYPCIYITSDINNQQMSSFRAYLIFGNAKYPLKKVTSRKLNKLDIQHIAYILGINSGVLVNKGNNYEFEGGIESKTIFSLATIDAITAGCQFIPLSLANSLIIDLSKDNLLFSSVKGNIDRQSTSGEDDPSLKKSDAGLLTAMRTNLYLDNTYKEESGSTNYDCPNFSQIEENANNFCVNSNVGLQMRSGTGVWDEIKLVDKTTCKIHARARFFATNTLYNCNGVMGDANNFCPANNLELGTIRPNSARWSYTELRGNKCISGAYATYQTIDCNFLSSCQYIDRTDNLFNCPETFNRFCPTWSGYWPAGIVSQAAYNPRLSGTKCSVHFYCRNFKYEYNPNGGASGELDANIKNYTGVFCGEKQVQANISIEENDMGYISCGSKIIDTITTTEKIPAKHFYRALDYGWSPVIPGQRIQLKSNAPDGDAAIMSSQLNINNAGLKAGFISPISHQINAGMVCDPNSVGKIAQDLSAGTNLISSQLQCMYNANFCNGSGYCYLPVKNSSFIYEYTSLKQLGQCPPGTIVDSSQPSDGIKPIGCPAFPPGWISPAQPIGLAVNSYKSSITGMTFYKGYQTTCRYIQAGNPNVVNDVPVNALQKLQCTNTTSTYTVDNYSP